MIWLQFTLSAIVIVAAAIKLAEYGDAIALRTGLSGMFIGTLLLAGATSLPELLTNLSALGQGVPDLAAGNLFGSSMFNMLLLGLLDLVTVRVRILRRVAMKHALTAGLATLLASLAVFFLLADIDVRLGWVGVDSLVLMAAYVAGVRLLRGAGSTGVPAPEPALGDVRVPGLTRAGLGFGGATLLLALTAPVLVRSSNGIAEVTGLSAGFIGAALLGVVTSLPELVTTVAAIRFGAYDLAVGNLFGSNIFNMFALGLTDVFYLPGRFLGAIDPTFALAGLAGLILTSLALISNLAHVERRLLFIELDSLLIFLGYCGGIWVLFSRGMGA